MWPLVIGCASGLATMLGVAVVRGILLGRKTIKEMEKAGLIPKWHRWRPSPFPSEPPWTCGSCPRPFWNHRPPIPQPHKTSRPPESVERAAGRPTNIGEEPTTIRPAQFRRRRETRD